MPLFSPTVKLLARHADRALAELTAEWNGSDDSEGFVTKKGVLNFDTPTCIANYSLRQETWSWPGPSVVFNHELELRNPGDSLDKLLTRKTSQGNDVTIPPHPLQSYRKRIDRMIAYIDRHVQSAPDADHVLIIDAPTAEEFNSFDECAHIIEGAIARNAKSHPCARLHVVIFVDTRLTYYIESDGIWIETSVKDALKGKAILGAKVVFCEPHRNALAAASIFGTFKRTVDTDYRADTLILPDGVEFDVSRISCLHASPNVSRSTITRGQRNFSFKATPRASVSLVFFVTVADTFKTSEEDATVRALDPWFEHIWRASSLDTSEACMGAIKLMDDDFKFKSIVMSDPTLSAINAICLNNATSKWNDCLLKRDNAIMEELIPPPSKRQCVVPTHSFSVM